VERTGSLSRRDPSGPGLGVGYARPEPLCGAANDLDGLRLSHHGLTADGILGRDTLDPAALDEAPVRRRTTPAPPGTGSHEGVRTIRGTLRAILGGGETAQTLDAGPHRE